MNFSIRKNYVSNWFTYLVGITELVLLSGNLELAEENLNLELLKRNQIPGFLIKVSINIIIKGWVDYTHSTLYRLIFHQMEYF